MKIHYRTRNLSGFGRLLDPGSPELIIGITMILIVVLAAIWSQSYQARIESLRESPYAIDYVNEPPAIGILRFLAGDPNEGQQNATGEFSLEVQEPELGSEPFHYLGTTELGDDLLAALMNGARTAIWGSLLAVIITIIIGVPLGIIAGYYRSRWGKLAVAFGDSLSAMPRLIVLIIVVATLGFDFTVIMVTIGVLAAPKLMSVIASQIDQLRKSDFIDSLQELGLPTHQIILRHILWANCRGLIVVQLMYEIAEVILLETSLSYLGWGVQDQVSWGQLVADGFGYLQAGHYWKLFFPALAIVFAIVAFSLVADGYSRKLDNA